MLIYYEACLNPEDAYRSEHSIKAGWGESYVRGRLALSLSFIRDNTLERHWHARVSVLLAALLLASAVPAADEALPTLAGGVYSVEAIVARGPAVLVFWNSWLPGADAFTTLIPEVERAARASGRTCVVVVFQDDAVAAAAAAQRSPSLTWVVDRHGQLLRRFQVTRAPSVVAIEKGGEVRGRAGPAADEVRALLASLGGR
jgi:hypothetical protein